MGKSGCGPHSNRVITDTLASRVPEQAPTGILYWGHPQKAWSDELPDCANRRAITRPHRGHLRGKNSKVTPVPPRPAGENVCPSDGIGGADGVGPRGGPGLARRQHGRRWGSAAKNVYSWH